MAYVRKIKMDTVTQNASLSRAKANKEDEFYTQREDVDVTGRFKTSHLWSIQNPPLVSRDFMVIL